jgi:plastocyanin
MRQRKKSIWFFMTVAVLLVSGSLQAQAAIRGVTGTSFNFTAKADYISTPEGNSILMWGYALNNGTMQYPGPTLIVNEGDVVTLTLSNSLSFPVSIVFPGQAGISASGGTAGLITREAPAGGSVTYTFTAAHPGTYTYYSGTRPDLQVEMGLMGAIVVRPAANPTTQAYNHAVSAFDHEYLFLLSEIDPTVHEQVMQGAINRVDNTKYFPVYWFINGRAAPDTMIDDNDPLLPTQPYSAMPMMHPGDRVLLRMVGGGRDGHPFHTHGNHMNVIARNGRLLGSTPASGADLAELHFTTSVIPGETADAIFTWTGEKLGWDVYGHQDLDNPPTGNFPGPEDNDHNGDGILNCARPTPAEAAVEYAPDHCKPLPVSLPALQDMTFGPWFSGTPYLGLQAFLPPGQGKFNTNGGFYFMWHSHNEKEIVNFDVFPGGLLTMMVVEHPSVVLTNP